MSLNPYLNFGGDCKAAFDFYRDVFGGDFSVFQTFGDGPDEMPTNEEDRDKVMHVSLPLGSSVLMGSDVPTGDFAPPHQPGNNVHISFEAASREEADARFAGLSEGGTVTMPLAEQFWGSYFGSCTDRFGIHWMVSVDETPG